MPATPISDPRAAQVAQYFECLSPAALADLSSIYAPQASFKDPFNEVRGLNNIRAVYQHMFDNLLEPRFVIQQALTQADHCFLTWDFSFRRSASSSLMRVHGASHLIFDANGLIEMHRDYWDTAQELYAKLPVVGALVRWITRRLALPVHMKG